MPNTSRLPLWSERVLYRLEVSLGQEVNLWLRDDIKIARLTVVHAAKGDAVGCSPHVLASYEVLGLHPDKVWPAILARRKALGWLDEEKPPKKPAQSVKLWCEKTDGARAANSHAAVQQGSPRTTISVPMAAPSIAAAYPNSGDSGSAKDRPFFTVADIEKFFEECPVEILSRRFRHFLRHSWIAAGRPFGTEILFFKAVEDYKKACYYKSATTARSNLRAAERLGLLEVAYRDAAGSCHHIWIRPRTQRDKGLYRRVTTHRLPVSLLLRWRHGHNAEITPIRKPTAPAPPPLPPAPAAPLPAKKVAEHRSPVKAAQPEPSTELFPERQRSRLRRRMQAILRQWDRNKKEASVGSSGEGLTFLSLVRQACDDELIDFELAWPFVEKLWWRNEQGWRKVMKLGQSEEGA